MPAGLQIWDAAGKLILDTTRRVPTVLGVLNQHIVNGAPSNGNIVNAGFARGVPFYYMVRFPYEQNYGSPVGVNVVIAGNTLTWSLNDPIIGTIADVQGSMQILYGYY